MKEISPPVDPSPTATVPRPSPPPVELPPVQPSAGETSLPVESAHSIPPFLIQLGAVAAVGGITASIGVALKLSDQKTAAFTVCVMLAIYIFIYRQTIQRKVKSPVLLVIGLFAIASGTLLSEPLMSVFLDRTISKGTGIVEYSPKANDFLPKIPGLIKSADEEIWLTGISFYITLPAYRDELFKALERGVNVRFLIYNPYSTNLEEVANSFGQTRGELAKECEMTVEHLETLAEQAKKAGTKGALEVRLFSSIPKMRLYMFDRRREEGHTYFIPHVDQQNTPNVPGFLAKNIKTGIVPPFIDGAERVWNKSMRFEEYLEKSATK